MTIKNLIPKRIFYPRGIRKFSLIILSLSLIFSLSFPVSSTPKSTVKLTLWTHQRHMADVIKELIAEFNATTGRRKGIEVSMRILGDDSWNLFQEAQRNAEGPDLYSSGFITGYSDPFKAKAQMWFDNFPDFKQWKRQWPSWYWIEGLTTHWGHVFAIPAQVFNSRLIYNRDLFRTAGLDPNRPPRSYQELCEYAQKITAGKRGCFGFAYCGAESWPMEWMPSQWAEANGDPAYWDWKHGRWALKGYGRVFQLLLDLNKDGSLFPGTATLTNEALRAQFAEGRIGMFMGELWDVSVLNVQFPAKCDWGVAPIPTYDGNFHGKSRAMMIAGLWNINGLSRHKFEAWEVVKWFDRYEIRAKMYERGKCIDPDPKVAGEFVKKQPKLHGFEEFAGTLDRDYLATYPILPGWVTPDRNPCSVFKDILIKGSDLQSELIRLDRFWNSKLDHYYNTHPEVNRGWNIYPEFDRRTGKLGPPLIKPVFSPRD